MFKNQTLLTQSLTLIGIFCVATPSVADTTAPGDSTQHHCDTRFEPATPSYDFHSAQLADLEDRQIRNVHITRLPIFDESNEDENNWLYRWANRIHVLTREDHLREQLLFESGEIYEARKVEESARLLRDLGHLYDAKIRLSSVCPETVDLEVVAKDVWSLTLDASYSRSGGENDYRFGIGETNLFGTGQKISIFTDKDDERTSTSLSYRDKNIGNSRWRTSVLLQDSDDGDQIAANLVLPFYSLNTRRSYGVGFNTTERVDTQWFRGEEITEVQHDIESFGAFYGFSNGLQNGGVNRYTLGYRYRKDEFSLADDFPPPAEFPIDQELSYPFFTFRREEDNYVTAFNLDQINRTEDLHLGYEFSVTFGYAAESFGSNADRFVFSGEFRDTIKYNEKILLRHFLEWEGLINRDTDASEDVIVKYGIDYFRSQTSHRSFYAALNLTWSENLNTNRQILLGGDTGVRGFERRLQSGDRAVVLTLEERQYTDIHILNLAYLGFAVFIDVGRAWDPDVDEGFEDDYLASAGFGIRLASSKSDSGRVIHIDFAFPLTNTDEPETDSTDISVSIKNTL
jgi:outer membrane protein assembly factor BamA